MIPFCVDEETVKLTGTATKPGTKARQLKSHTTFNHSRTDISGCSAAWGFGKGLFVFLHSFLQTKAFPIADIPSSVRTSHSLRRDNVIFLA
jgi:hypothetical protein